MDSSCGGNSMRSGVEALTSLHQRLGNSEIPNDVSQCNNCESRCRHGNNWGRSSDGRVCGTSMGQSTGTWQVGASRTTVGHCEQARTFRLRCETAAGQSTAPAGLRRCSTQVRCQYGRSATRRPQAIRECSRAISVVASPRRTRKACSWWQLGLRQRSEYHDHGIGKKKKNKGKKTHRKEILRQSE